MPVTLPTGLDEYSNRVNTNRKRLVRRVGTTMMRWGSSLNEILISILVSYDPKNHMM